MENILVVNIEIREFKYSSGLKIKNCKEHTKSTRWKLGKILESFLIFYYDKDKKNMERLNKLEILYVKILLIKEDTK